MNKFGGAVQAGVGDLSLAPAPLYPGGHLRAVLPDSRVMKEATLAIRQSDEQFMVKTILPALMQAEAHLEALDMATTVMAQDDEIYVSPLHDLVTTAIDETMLRIKRQGSWSWASIKERWPGIMERCEHKITWPWDISEEVDGEEVKYRVRKCQRCSFEVSREVREEEGTG